MLRLRLIPRFDSFELRSTVLRLRLIPRIASLEKGLSNNPPRRLASASKLIPFGFNHNIVS